MNCDRMPHGGETHDALGGAHGCEYPITKQAVDKGGRDTVSSSPFLGTDYAEYEVSRETRP